MSLDDKVKFYNSLLNALTKGVKLAAVLDEQQRADEAEGVRRKNSKLAKAAGDVRSSISKDWAAATDAMLDDLRDVSSKLQTQLRQIQESLDTAAKVVKAMGYLDELIALAARVIA